MTEDAKNPQTPLWECLLPYVEEKTARRIAEKEEAGELPLTVSDLDLLSGMRADLLECMRELHRKGTFKAVRGINNPMLMKM